MQGHCLFNEDQEWVAVMRRTKPWKWVIVRSMLLPVAAILLILGAIGEWAEMVYDRIDGSIP